MGTLPDSTKLTERLHQRLLDYGVDMNGGILLAVSGGVDSMCLLALFTALRDAGKLTFDVMHINHQLREDAARDQQLVIDYCEAHDIDLAVRIWRHGSITSGIEAQARDFRYANFAEYLHSHHYRYLMTAHHLEDVSETLFMRLIQGHGVQSVQSIRPLTRLYNYPAATVVRPLIDITKADLYALAKKWAIPYREDSSNSDSTFTRNRIRNHWLKALETEDPKVVTHLFDFARELQATVTLADQQLEALATDAFTMIDHKHWLIDRRALPDLTADVWEQLLMHCLYQIDSEAFQSFGRNGRRALADFILSDTPQGEWSLPGDYVLRKEYQALIISRLMSDSDRPSTPSPSVSKTTTGTDAFPIPAEYTAEPLRIRQRQAGDRVRLADDHHQKVTRFLVNHKIPQPVRDRLWVVVVGTSEVLGLVDPNDLTVLYAYQSANSHASVYWHLDN